MGEKKQVLYTDMMHEDGRKFLTSVSVPLYLTMRCLVERETKHARNAFARAIGIAAK